MIQRRSQKTGFTMLEVVLVLGIAGLIFLMTFVALPALQRQARNTQRESDISDLIDMIKKFQTNNRGALPGGGSDDETVGVNSSSDSSISWAGFYKDYLGSNFVDPLGANYQLHIVNCGGMVVGSACDGKVTSLISEINSKSFEENDHTIQIVKQAKCARDEQTGVVANSSGRKVAVLYRLEGGGLYCENT